jgi:alkaline phosphatase
MRRQGNEFVKTICLVIVVALFWGCGAVYAQTKAKNVILMISDGCGYNHVDAASIYQHGKTGSQIYDRFKVKLAMSTYMDGQSYDPTKAWSDFKYVSKNKSYTDSAAAATVMSTGVKTFYGAVGLGPDKAPLEHSVQMAEKVGKATGVVTTVQISHATPAGFVAHNKSRNNYDEIAGEMIYKSGLEVIMGCGHPEYDNDGRPAGRKDYKYVGGKTVWDDLEDGSVTGADADGDGTPDIWTVVHEPAQFRKLASGPTPKRVIGIPKKRKTLQQERGGNGKAPSFQVP